MNDLRKQFNAMFFAAQGAGKTIQFLKLVLRYHKAHPVKRILFLLPDDQEEKFDSVPEIYTQEIPTFTGIKKVIAGKSTIKWMRDFYLPDPETISREDRKRIPKLNALVALDDPAVYLGRYPEPLYDMFGRRRQLNADFLSAFPGIRKKAPPGYYGYCTHLFLGQTTDSPKDLVDELPLDKQEEFMEMYNRVQLLSKADKYHMEEMVVRGITG